MSRPRCFARWELPSSVVVMVTAICADYHRREEEIKHSDITGEVLARYVEYNAAVEKALSEIEVGFREDFLADLAMGRGYARSRAGVAMSKNAYYRRRHRLIHDIATALRLYPE